MLVVSLVALRKESVDRNLICLFTPLKALVALRKESVDRNLLRIDKDGHPAVALRKESVDRNVGFLPVQPLQRCRSPQGERG